MPPVVPDGHEETAATVEATGVDAPPSAVDDGLSSPLHSPPPADYDAGPPSDDDGDLFNHSQNVSLEGIHKINDSYSRTKPS